MQVATRPRNPLLYDVCRSNPHHKGGEMVLDHHLARSGLALAILIAFSIGCSSSSPATAPAPTDPPSEVLQITAPSGALIFLEGNDCMQDVVGEIPLLPGQSINIQEDDRLMNDAARSAVLLDLATETRLALFDSPDADQADDWTEIGARRHIDVYCVTTFERAYEDEFVQVTHHHHDGLDGEISRIETGVGASIVSTAASPAPSTPPPSPTLTEVPSETPTTPPTIPSVREAACVPTGTPRQVAIVTRIVDGDTIDVEIDGVPFRVRYIGIDTPESGEPFFSQATGRNAALVRGETVTLVKDVSETDIYDRLLRYVLVGNVFVNYELVHDGYALPSTYPPDVACANTFLGAQRNAVAAGLGLWTATSTPYPTSTSPPSQPICHPSYQGACLQPGIGDYDCGCGSGNGPNYLYERVKVVGYDEFRLDGDRDGWGCECYP